MPLNQRHRVVIAHDHDREETLMWSRKYSNREDILNTESDIERSYLLVLYRYISKYDFSAGSLRISEKRRESIMTTAKGILDARGE